MPLDPLAKRPTPPTTAPKSHGPSPNTSTTGTWCFGAVVNGVDGAGPSIWRSTNQAIDFFQKWPFKPNRLLFT